MRGRHPARKWGQTLFRVLKIGSDPIVSNCCSVAALILVVTTNAAAQSGRVVRGTDLFAATHVHRLLQAVLGLPTPA